MPGFLSSSKPTSMFPLLETIKIKNGIIHYPEEHQTRMDQSVRTIFGSKAIAPSLEENIQLPHYIGDSWFKCRIIYGLTIAKTEYEPYQRPRIQSLELVDHDEISYDLKWADRSEINKLVDGSSADNIIIVKKGQITDSSYANLLFWKKGRWYTPANPLLPGTQRARLLREGEIFPERITRENLHRFEKVKWINAMLDMKDGPEWPLSIIRNLY